MALTIVPRPRWPETVRDKGSGTMGSGKVTRREPVRLYPGVAPGSESWTHSRSEYHSTLFDNRVVTNVVAPTITPVVPDRSNGTGLVIAPGGGFHALSIESEGFAVADWLADRGVAAFVLEYRLVPCGDDAVGELLAKMTADIDDAFDQMNEIAPLAEADARVAVAWVRDHAADFGVRPERVGLIGFSAGGNVAMRVAYADDARERPSFVAPIYASVRGYELASPPAGSGPMFLAAASDDPLGLADDSVRIYETWRRAGIPTELHLYATGGHGFGMQRQGLPSDAWIDRFGDWLAASGLS